MSQSTRTQILAACILLWCQSAPSQEAVKILDSSSVQSGGRTITFQRIEPPKETAAAPVAAPVVAASSAASALTREEIVAKWNRRRSVLLSLSCTVHEAGVSEVRWWEANGAEVRIVSSIDFNYLRGVGDFTAEERNYSVFMGVGNAMSAGTAARLRAGGAAVPASVVAAPVSAEVLAELKKEGGSRYVIISAPKNADAEAFRGIDDLHRHYDAHKDELIAAWKQSEADRIAREQWLKEHPPGPPPDTVIQFWPKKGSRYLDAGAGNLSSEKEAR